MDTQLLDDEDLDSSMEPKHDRKFRLPQVQVPNTYRELPNNDLVWWGMTILSTFVVVETFVVGTAAKMITESLVSGFQIWVNAGAPSPF